MRARVPARCRWDACSQSRGSQWPRQQRAPTGRGSSHGRRRVRRAPGRRAGRGAGSAPPRCPRRRRVSVAAERGSPEPARFQCRPYLRQADERSFPAKKCLLAFGLSRAGQFAPEYRITQVATSNCPATPSGGLKGMSPSHKLSGLSAEDAAPRAYLGFISGGASSLHLIEIRYRVGERQLASRVPPGACHSAHHRRHQAPRSAHRRLCGP
jgi:hypothetical protein